MTNEIIDVHSHPLVPTYKMALLGSSDGKNDSVGGMPLPQWSEHLHVETMDANGIALCILSLPEALQSVKSEDTRTMARAMNEELAALVSARPSRFGSMAVLPLADMNSALEELAYALDALRMDGIALDTNHAGLYLGDEFYHPLLEELNRRSATLFVHPTAGPDFDQSRSRLHVSALEYMFDTTRMITTMVMSGAKKRFNKINIITTHGGGTIPYLVERLLSISRMPWAFRGGPPMSVEQVQEGLASFYYDLTASASLASLDALTNLVSTDRLLTGFDFPMMPSATIGPAKETLSRYFQAPKDQQKIASSNALRLFSRFQKLSMATSRKI